MRAIVLGAGIIGVSMAWHLHDRGHEVAVVDRPPDTAPLKVAKWLLRKDSPLLFRPRLDPQQWRWGQSFLTQCNDAAFERNVRQLVALGRYSHDSLKRLVAATGIEYQRLEHGILH